MEGTTFIKEVKAKLDEKQANIDIHTIIHVYQAILSVIKDSLILKNKVLIPKLGTINIKFMTVRKGFPPKKGATPVKQPKLKIKASTYLYKNVIVKIQEEMGNNAS